MKPLAFSFDKYELTDAQALIFHYSYRDASQQIVDSFAERYQLPCRLDQDDALTTRILQCLHIIVGVSYYKSLLGPIVLPYKLDQAEAAYWNTVYDNGLRELAYNNELTAAITPFVAASQSEPQAAVPVPGLSGALLGIGGGKDSVVAGELLKHLGVETAAMHVGTGQHNGQAGKVMGTMGLDQLCVERYVDTGIATFTDQHQGYHGHIPVSAIFAWLGILLAYTTSKKYIVMANEAAASVGNIAWNGHEVNHQWSKSLEFETLTQAFVRQRISPDLHYFSPIRPYGSLAVMKLFVKLGGAYVADFTSCNLVLRIDPAARPNGRWCARCPKCLSTWLLLSGSLNIHELQAIFGSNLFDDMSLRPLLNELLGLEGHKPLDCVGTIEELRAVTRQALQTFPAAPLLAGLTAEVISGPNVETLINNTGSDDSIPVELRTKLRDFVSAALSAARSEGP